MITFDPAVPLWLVVSSFVAITLLLLWKEWGRKLRFRTLRLLAVFVMMLTLAAILLRPLTNISKSTAILLLTRGYKVNQIDSLISSRGNLRIIHTPDAEPYKDSKPLRSYHELHDLDGNIGFVVGEGLPAHALDLVVNKTFTYLPGNPPEGIFEVSVSDKPKANRQSNVIGSFRNQSGVHSISLVGPGGKEDSVTIIKNGATQFTLSFAPRKAGKLLYSLSIRDSLGNITEEKFPVIVEEPSALKVLVVLSYPTFETTFLKNFIASRGGEIVSRSQLSRANFNYEYINHAVLRFSVLTKNVLDEFDLLVADRRTLQNLSNQESSALKQSIQNGLGLLSLYDVTPREKDQNNFFPFRTLRTNGDTTTIKSGSKRLTLPALPYRVAGEAPLQRVLTNDSGILSGYTPMGGGKIGFQLLQETYRLMLTGDTITYGNVWSPLLERISRGDERSASVSITSPFPYYADEPISLRLISSEESPTLLADNVRTSLSEDVRLDDVWHARVWPTSPGWHTLQTDGQSLEYFVSETDGWHSLAIENQMKENRLSSRTQQLAAETSGEHRRIDPLLFYGTFLIAAGFLWLAPKL